MATRSFYLSEESDRIIAERSSGGIGRGGDRSGVVERIIGRYAAIVETETPKFTAAEWRQLMRVLQWPGTREVWTLAMLDQVATAHGAEPELARKLGKLRLAERVAVADEVERRLLAKSGA